MRESSRARKAFDDYFNLGPDRTLVRLHERLSETWARPPGLRTLDRWSSRFGWQSRIGKLEQEAQEAEDRARIEAIKEMRERQIHEALLMQQKGTQHLANHAGRLTNAEARRLIVEGTKIERLARGEVTEISRIDYGEQRIRELSDEELDRVIEIARNRTE